MKESENSMGGINKVRFPDDEAFRCLRAGEIDAFQRLVAERNTVDFSDADLRGVDLHAIDLGKVILRGAYLRDADLRGQDLRHHDMSGCSLYHARISGVFFPENLTADEIRLSVDFGTRLRVHVGSTDSK